MRKYRILLVDDDPIILTGIRKILELDGYQVTTANNGEKALALLRDNDFDLVITDLVMEAVDGLQVLKMAKQRLHEVMVIILTGYGDLNSAIEALRLGADDFLLKPCNPTELSLRVTKLLGKLELTRKIKLYEKMLPVCCACKKIRDDAGKEPGKGQWLNLEDYLWNKTRLEITSTYCPQCAIKALDELKEE